MEQNRASWNILTYMWINKFWCQKMMQRQFIRRRIVFSTDGNGTIRSMDIKMNFDPYTSPYAKIDSKWFNVIPIPKNFQCDTYTQRRKCDTYTQKLSRKKHLKIPVTLCKAIIS